MRVTYETATQQENEMVEIAIKEAQAYTTSPEAKQDMEVRLIKLKSDFYRTPGPATSEREKQLCSPKNIVFLYIEAKLMSLGVVMEHMVEEFDKEKKGLS